MPHKRNPILSERMTGLARVLRGYAQVGLENVALWHERDISHSSAERIVLPDASITLHYMLVKFSNLIDNLVVQEERMAANLEATKGLIFSQAVLLALVEIGLTRDDAYSLVQSNAMDAWDGKGQLKQLLSNDPDVALTDKQLDECFALDRVSYSAGVVFDRLDRPRNSLSPNRTNTPRRAGRRMAATAPEPRPPQVFDSRWHRRRIAPPSSLRFPGIATRLQRPSSRDQDESSLTELTTAPSLSIRLVGDGKLAALAASWNRTSCCRRCRP